jgi:PAS domain S-box-containing protein
MPNRPIHILHLEDDAHDCDLVEAMLRAEDIPCQIECVQTGEDFRSKLTGRAPDLIISDYSMPGYDGLRALRLAREIVPAVPFIFFSGTLGEESAVISLKEGATDYILKQRPGRLVASVRRALAEARERRRRELAEEKLRDQAALLDEARDAICLQDLDQRILFWNKSAERLYGWTAEQAIGHDANELLIQDAVALAACKELIGRGEWHGELHQVTRAGRTLIVESRWTLIRDPAGQPKAILVINTDITEKKEMEAQYLRAQRIESIGMLAGGMAHDLNNILGPILMSAELLLQSDSDDVLLQAIATSAQRGTDLVRQILAFARGADGDKIPLDLRRVVSDATSLFGSTFPRNIVIANRVPPELPHFLGNATQFHQIILNLCVNARDAMPAGGTITLEAAAVSLENRQTSLQSEPLTGSYIELRVSDTGSGIPPEILPKILDPFFTTKAAGKGTGLGLATVVGIVRGHGGSLDVATEPGHGTTFTLYFPATPESLDSRAFAAPAASGECILCADDEAAVLTTTRTALVRAGYRILAARDGGEALALFHLHRQEIALVITDMMMPVMNGAELITALRSLAPGLRIIATSGTFSRVKLPEEPGTAVEAILHKPFAVAALLSTVRDVLAAHPA